MDEKLTLQQAQELLGYCVKKRRDYLEQLDWWWNASRQGVYPENICKKMAAHCNNILDYYKRQVKRYSVLVWDLKYQKQEDGKENNS